MLSRRSLFALAGSAAAVAILPPAEPELVLGYSRVMVAGVSGEATLGGLLAGANTYAQLERAVSAEAASILEGES